MQTQKRNDQVAGNRLSIYRQRFENLSNEIQITKAFESVGFLRRVSIGMYRKTYVDDDFGDNVMTCRICKLLREDSDSEMIAWICGTIPNWPSYRSSNRLRGKVTIFLIQLTLQKVVDYRIIQVSEDRTRFYQTWRTLLRQSREDNHI